MTPRWMMWLGVALLFTLGGLVFLLTRNKDVLGRAFAEVDAIKADAEAQKLAVDLGAHEASKIVEERYQAEMEELTADNIRRAEQLRANPRQLARELARVSARKVG